MNESFVDTVGIPVKAFGWTLAISTSKVADNWVIHKLVFDQMVIDKQFVDIQDTNKLAEGMVLANPTSFKYYLDFRYSVVK
jgi:hypothetical protein